MGLKTKKFKKAAKKAGKSFKKGAKKVGKAVKNAGTIGKNDLKKLSGKVGKNDLRQKFLKQTVKAHTDVLGALSPTAQGLKYAKGKQNEKEDEANQAFLDEQEADARNTREQAAKRKRLEEEEENDTRGTKTGGTGRVSLRI